MEENRFNEAMTEFERKIESLSEDRKPALRALAKETRNRATEIRQAGEAGRAAAVELMQTLARFSEAKAKLVDRATSLTLQIKYAKFDAEARERELRGEGRNHGD